MQNAESNPTQPQQQEMAARSPVKTPATGTAGPDARTQAREFGSTNHASSAEPHPAGNGAPLQPVETPVSDAIKDPVQRANARIVPLNVKGTASTDDTVDADGKALEAKQDAPLLHDNVITSNATLENNVPAPAAGLGGIDSRERHGLPLIATRPGQRVVCHGSVVFQRFNGGRAELVFSLEPDR